MIRDSPCDDPLSWAGIKASKPSTFVCCLERWYAVALPIAPRPTTITSNALSTVVLHSRQQTSQSRDFRIPLHRGSVCRGCFRGICEHRLHRLRCEEWAMQTLLQDLRYG